MRDHQASPRTLRVDLTLPSTKLTFGSLAYDPLKQILGIDLRALLAPLLRGEPYIKTVGTAAVQVFPLDIAPGTRVSVPLGIYGELAVGNDQGLLALTVPIRAGRWLEEQAGDLIVGGPIPIADDDGVHRASAVWLRLDPGMRTSLPLGLIGELGLEAA